VQDPRSGPETPCGSVEKMGVYGDRHGPIERERGRRNTPMTDPEFVENVLAERSDDLLEFTAAIRTRMEREGAEEEGDGHGR